MCFCFVFFFKQLLFGTIQNWLPFSGQCEVSRIARALQEYQRQNMLSIDMAAFHILIPVQEFILEKP